MSRDLAELHPITLAIVIEGIAVLASALVAAFALRVFCGG